MTENLVRLGLPDTAARRRAATDFATNLVLIAGAGTGKTGLLVERALVAIGAGIVEIPRLAAITFTDKAAAEMRERLAAGLQTLWAITRGEIAPGVDEAAGRAYSYLVRETGVSPAAIGRRALEALGGMDQAAIHTIHTFCSQMLRAHPREARVDPGFVVDPGEHLESLFDEAWESFLAEELGAGAARPELWRRILGKVPEREVREIGRGLSTFAVPDGLLEPHGDTGELDRLLRGYAEEVVSAIDSILRRQVGMSDAPCSYLVRTRKVIGAFLAGGIVALRRAVREDPWLEGRIDTRPPDPNKNLRGVAPAEFEETAREACRLVRGLRNTDGRLPSDLIEAVSPFARSFRETYLSRGYVSFDGLLALARKLLRDHLEVREALKQRFRMLLVDEFQDTDPLQYEIVLFLAERPGGRAADPFTAELEPGRLFIVGDPKQSIYRFRGADYTAFRRAVDRVVAAGGTSLDLTANFRSVPGVLEPVNALFRGPESPTWTESRYQPAYVAIEPVRPGGAEPRVEVWTVEIPPASRANDRREAEGRIIAREIRRLVEEEKAYGYGDVSILLRAFSPLVYYLRPLREWNIPFVVDGGREFLERPEVGHLLSTLRALAQPSDPVALLAFLRSPAGGVPDAELAAYAAQGGRWDWQREVQALLFPNLSRAFRKLCLLSGEMQHLPPGSLVRTALRHMDLLPLSAVAFEGPQRVVNLRKLVAAAARLGEDGRLSLLEILDALEAGRASDIDADSPLADEGTHAVRVLTVHKAKGLENQVVIVPDLAREDRRAARPPPVEIARLPGGGSAVALRTRAAQNAARVWLDRDTESHEKAEEVRVLYVAATRARERLIVLACGPGERAPWVKALRGWGYVSASPPPDGALLHGGRVLHRRMAALRPDHDALPDLPEGVEEAVVAYGRARDSLRASAVPLLASPSRTEEEADLRRRGLVETERSPSPLSDSRALGRAAGAVLHRLLERWEGQDARSWLAPLRAVAASAAEQERVEPEALEKEAREIAEAFLASPLAKRLLELRVRGREVPVLLEKDGVVWWGSIDLLYEEEPGRYVVADFKTGRDVDNGASLYRDQLEIYREGARRALRLAEPPRAELWMLRSGRIVVL